jgi:hypothetical protein
MPGEGVRVHPSGAVKNFATVNDGQISPVMEEKLALVDVEEPSELGSSPDEITWNLKDTTNLSTKIMRLN